MRSLPLTGDNRDSTADEAVRVLLQGGIIAYPTETFYGLGAKFDLPQSLERLYDLKRRPGDKAMPVIIADRTMLSLLVPADWLAATPPKALRLIETFWPGPLTLLMPSLPELSEHLTARTGKIAVRVPGESFALSLARKAGFPITATSANVSGRPPAETGETVLDYFDGRIDLLIDGGPSPGGLPSTIVDVSGDEPTVLREGAVGSESLTHILHESRIRGAGHGI